jgi:hypothetical protein
MVCFPANSTFGIFKMGSHWVIHDH